MHNESDDTGGMTMATTPEGIVKDAIKDVLTKHNIAYSMKVTMGYGKSGWPDIDVVLRGIFVTIEAKYDAARNRPTALQRDAMQHIRQSGGITLVVDINTLSAFDSFITDVMALHSTGVRPAVVKAIAKLWQIFYDGEVYA